jgi:hypothetical protein
VIIAVPTPEALKTRWARLSAVVAVLSTVALSAVLLLTGSAPSRLLILWFGCFPAFWLALKIVGVIAWETSFKVTSRLKIPASPTQVFAAEIACLVALLALHAIASWAWAHEGLGVAIVLAWLLYAAAAIAVSVAVYLPSLLVAKVLVRQDT